MRAIKRVAASAALAVSAVAVLAQPAAASFAEQFSATPPGALTWDFSAVSCTGPTSCIAVGSFDDNTGTHPLAERLSGTTWSLLSSPQDPGSAQLDSISCLSATSCAAVGSSFNGSNTVTLAEVWNGSSWATQTTPNPSGGTNVSLSSVSCTSGTSCEAVGSSFDGTTTTALAEGWNGSHWAIQTTPNPSGATLTELNGVSCGPGTACEAVGSSRAGSTTTTLAEGWNGSHWAIQATPNGTGSFSQLSGVSCTAANACTAVGSALAERWNGSSWTLQPISKPHGAGLSAVSCTSLNRCMAVGEFFVDGVGNQVAEQWDGTTWRVKQTPISTSSDEAALSGVSCVHATACSAVGFYHDPTTGDRALIESWGLRWQLNLPAIPAGAIASSLQTVSCPFTTFCAAVGGDEQSGSEFDAVVQTWNGNTWTVGTTPNASNSNLSGVSCNGAKVCTAVGDVVSGAGLASLAERWDGTNWTVQSTPNPSGAVHSFLISVSCPSTKSCIAVGFWTNSGGDQTPFAEHWNGTSWSLHTTPFPSGSTTSQLNGVSCTSSTACQAVGTDNIQTWADVWNGTAWTMKATPTPSGGHSAHLSGVSCTAANACTAVGDYVNSASKVVPLAERWNGTSWTSQHVPAPSGSASGLSSVACNNAATSFGCNAVGFVQQGGVGLPMAENWDGSKWATRATQAPADVTRSNLASVSCPSLIQCMAVGFYDTSGGLEAALGELYS